MSFNFPSPATEGQEYVAVPGGATYIYKNGLWMLKATEAPMDGETYGRQNNMWVEVTEEAPSDGLVYGRKNENWATIIGGAVVSDTPPGPPLQNGQLWYESDTGNTYIYYADADSQQWVQQNIQPGTPPAPTGLTANIRNRIVNGAMQISQEYGNTAVGVGQCAADQWQTAAAGAGFYTLQRVQAVTPNGSQNRLRFVVTTADTTMDTGDIYCMQQNVEGIRIADFRWGTASARQVVLRFGFKGPAGTYSASFRNSTASRSYHVNFTIAAGQANTDTEQVFAIPGDVTGTWLTDTGVGLSLFVSIAVGATRQSAPGVWTTGNMLGSTANTNGMSTVGNTFELFDVGLYLDPLNTGVAPRWELPDEAEELQACQRYWQASSGRACLNWSGHITAIGNAQVGIASFKVNMRTTPVLTFVDVNSAGFNALPFAAASGYVHGIEVERIAAGAGYGYFITNYVANARM